MYNIKIVRLHNGEDIIGNITDKENGLFDIEEPMTVDIDHRGRQAGLIMKHWLPVQLVKSNKIELNNKNVLCMFEPAEEFAEYYMNTVEKIHELLKAKEIVDEMTDEEIDDIMDELDSGYYGDTLH
jgi:hypothetical protein